MTTFFSPVQENLYHIFCNYYDDPIMTKIKATETETTFAVEIPSLLLSEKRYLILTSKRSYPTDKIAMCNVFWNSLQLRTLPSTTTSFPNVNKHTFTMKREPVYYSKIHIKDRNENISTYSSDLSGLLVSLLHTKKLKFEYPNEGSLISALETYQTIVQMV